MVIAFAAPDNVIVDPAPVAAGFIDAASKKDYKELREAHVEDYRELFRIFNLKARKKVTANKMNLI